MRTFRGVLIILILFGAIFGFVGWKLYKSRRVAVLKKINDERGQLEAQKQNNLNQLESMTNFSASHGGLFARSFPMNPSNARIEYQMWLSQLAEFCEMPNAKIQIGAYQRGQGTASNKFQLQVQCKEEALLRFLYEFSWTGFLHRIDSLDIQPVAGSDELSVTMLIEGLSLAKLDQRNPYPDPVRLPPSRQYLKRLASGPFATYSPYARANIFQYAQSGFDDASFAILTGIPSKRVSEEEPPQVTTRWNIGSIGKTLTVGVGEKLQIGSFDGVIESIDDDIVYLRQNGGRLWALSLGDKLSDAVALPNEF